MEACSRANARSDSSRRTRSRPIGRTGSPPARRRLRHGRMSRTSPIGMRCRGPDSPRRRRPHVTSRCPRRHRERPRDVPGIVLDSYKTLFKSNTWTSTTPADAVKRRSQFGSKDAGDPMNPTSQRTAASQPRLSVVASPAAPSTLHHLGKTILQADGQAQTKRLENQQATASVG